MLYWLFLFLIHFKHKLESSKEGNLNSSQLEEYPKWLASRQACETLYTYVYIHTYM